MKSKIEEFYLSCPPFMQNIGLSLYGLKENMIRHGGVYSQYNKILKNNLSLTKKNLHNYQLKKLFEYLKECLLFVPYYRDMAGRYNINLKKINQIDDIRIFPLLDKEIVRNKPDILINERYKKKRLHKIHTTGTTGTPLKIFCDSTTRQKNYAFYQRFLSLAGINYLGRRATFGGRIILQPDQKKPPFWRYSAIQRNLLFSSYHLTDENIGYYIDKLRDFQPDYIDAYPSSIYILAKYMIDHGISGLGITKGITTSAETLFNEQRAIIEKVFGVKVFDQYGSAEMSIFVGQCSEGVYHIHSDYGIMELIKEDGTTASIGEEGEIVCTSFINSVMPLVRYRIGDRGMLSKESCSCGLKFPIMKSLLGRMDDIIETPDGRKIGRLSPVLKGFPIQEAQYVQSEKNSVTVRIVKSPNYSKATEERVIEELRKRLGHVIKIQIEYHDVIPRTAGGKLKTVISLLSK